MGQGMGLVSDNLQVFASRAQARSREKGWSKEQPKQFAIWTHERQKKSQDLGWAHAGFGANTCLDHTCSCDCFFTGCFSPSPETHDDSKRPNPHLTNNVIRFIDFTFGLAIICFLLLKPYFFCPSTIEFL